MVSNRQSIPTSQRKLVVQIPLQGAILRSTCRRLARNSRTTIFQQPRYRTVRKNKTGLYHKNLRSTHRFTLRSRWAMLSETLFLLLPELLCASCTRLVRRFYRSARRVLSCPFSSTVAARFARLLLLPIRLARVCRKPFDTSSGKTRFTPWPGRAL